ncbi:MAG: hypothetical protein ABIS47_13125, partial [Acidimicrobiales bacterium]
PPPHDPPAPASPEQSWRGLAVGLAAGIAFVLLVIAVFAATRGDDKPTVPAPVTTVASSAGASSTQPATSLAAPGGTATIPPTTRKPTPLPIVAADDRRVVVLDQTGSTPPRTLFDLGPSTSEDQAPPLIGGVSLSGDGTQAYFDVVGTPVAGSLRRVPVAGGPADQIGAGVGPAPSPDGSMLALIQAPDPDVPAIVVLRTLPGGAERRFELGDGTCGNIAWAPGGRELAVDICSGGEPVTVAVIDVASAGLRQLTPPDGVTWSIPAFKPDGTLTLVEQRDADAVVVSLTPDRNRVAASILRRASTTINTIDWSGRGDLLVCDVDGIVVAAVGGGQAEQVATGYTSAAW